MSQMIAILSMLHEPPGTHSANRLYHGEPVLGRLARRVIANLRFRSGISWEMDR
jgi:hypothetical protein